VTFEFRTAHTKQLTALFPCGDGGADCRRRAIEGVVNGEVGLDAVIETDLDPARAPALHERLHDDDASVGLGSTIRWRSR